MSSTKGLWITYDFSRSENIENFYKWLASLDSEPKECGINTVFVGFGFTNKEELKQTLLAAVPGIEIERIYAIYGEDNRTEGTFLFGKRKLKNPWDIYLTANEVEVDG
jgi:hypothetical protein